MLRDALSAISSGDRTGRLAHLAVLNELGRCSFALCEWADAHEYFARGLDLARREGDRRLEGVLSVNLGNVLSELHESESCLEHYREALQIHRLHADADGQSLALHDPAVVHARIGDGAESIRCAREAMRLVQSSGRWTLDAGRWTQHQTGLLLAEQLLQRGELAEARDLAETALAEARDAGSTPATTHALSTLAKVERHAGETERAKRLLSEALRSLESIDDITPKLEVRVELARVHEAAGRTDAALAIAEEAARSSSADCSSARPARPSCSPRGGPTVPELLRAGPAATTPSSRSPSGSPGCRRRSSRSSPERLGSGQGGPPNLRERRALAEAGDAPAAS